MKIVKIGVLLKRIKETINIDDNFNYKRVTVKGKNQGITLRDIEKGSNIGTKKQFIVREGQFLLSKIDARNGAFGIVSEKLNGAIVTGNFWAFEVNKELMNIEWFNIFVSSSAFINICSNASSGTTNRQYLNETKFLEFEIHLPNLKEQLLFINRYKAINEKFLAINKELMNQRKSVIKLIDTIIVDAIKGNLIQKVNSNEVKNNFLTTSQKENERLLQETIIEKDNLLSNNNSGELTYELPQGWKSGKLGDLAVFQKGFAFKSRDYQNEGIKVTKVSNLNNPLSNDFVYIDLEKKKLYEQFELLNNDIVLTTVGSWPLSSPKSAVGNAILIQNDFNGSLLNQNAVRLRVNSSINFKFLFYTLISPLFKEYVNIVAQGTANQASLTQTSIKNFVIGIPPLKEQKKIIKKIELLIQVCINLEKLIEQAKLENENLMKSFLQENFAVKEEIHSQSQ